MSVGIAELLIIIVGAVYVVPSVIAVWRDHPSKISIILLNLLLGWTLLGWVGALVWALTPPPTPPPNFPR